MISNSKAATCLSILSAALMASAAWALPSFGDWSVPQNMESLPGSSTLINTPAVDGCTTQSPDGLSIVFNSNRGGSQDLYIARRKSVSEGYGAPERLPAPVNLTTSDEFCPTLRRGGRLYFSSTRGGDIGDLYVTREGPKGWSEPTRLDGISTPAMEESAAFYEDDSGRDVMLFSRRQANGSGGQIWQSVDGGSPTLVGGGPNEAGSNARPSITHDGKTIFFDSIRPGGLGGPDLYVATRAGAEGSFSAATHLTGLSSSAFDARPYISWDGRTLTFSSARPGSESAAPDIWFATREPDTSLKFRTVAGR